MIRQLAFIFNNCRFVFDTKYQFYANDFIKKDCLKLSIAAKR